jgi:hypothetical protein
MGFWGAALYANDTTCDVRDTYVKYLREQLSNEEAFQKTLETCSEYLEDDDEQPLLWFALAETQWKVGRLMPDVKEEALSWIEKRGGLEQWEESANGGLGWGKTLQKLKQTLTSPQPPEKKIRKPVEFKHNPWNIGDCYAYKFNTDITKKRNLFGKYIVLQKIGDYDGLSNDCLLSIIQVFDKVFDKIPNINAIMGVRILPLIHSDVQKLKLQDPNYDSYFDSYLRAYMDCERRHQYPCKYLSFIGNQSIPRKEFSHKQLEGFDWDKNQMDDCYSYFYLSWQGIEY